MESAVLHQLFVLLDRAGQIPSAIDTALAKAEGEGVVNINVMTAHRAVGDLGLALAAMETFLKQQAAPAVPAGGRIADVGDLGEPEAGYTGNVDPDLLTREQWGAWSQHPALWRWQGLIFSKRPFIGIAGTGYVYTQGDLATAVPDDTPFREAIQRWELGKDQAAA